MADEFASNASALDSPARSAAAVTPGTSPLSTVARGLYVGSSGNVTVTMAGGGDVLFVGIAGGTILPVRVSHVLATGTTASSIVALW